jgi:hypothetical protein
MPKTTNKPANKTVLSPKAQEAKKALAAMTPDLKEVFEKINSKAVTANADEVLARYNYGKWISTVVQDKRKYGENAAELLATALGISTTLLYSWRALYNQWKDEYSTLKTLLEKKTAVGTTLTFSHFVLINKVSSATERLSLVEQCISECLSVADLEKMLAEKYGKRDSSTATVMPRNPVAGIAVMTKALEKVGDSHKKIQTSIFEKIENEPEEFTDDGTIAKLEALMADIVSAKNLLDEDNRRLQATLDTLSRVRDGEDDDDGEPDEPVAKAPAPKAVSKSILSKKPAQAQPPKVVPRTTSTLSRIRQAQDQRAAMPQKRISITA